MPSGNLDEGRKYERSGRRGGGGSLSRSATSHGRARPRSATDFVSQFGLLILRKRRKRENLSSEKECRIEHSQRGLSEQLINHHGEIGEEADLR